MERRRDLQSLKFLNRKRRQAEFGNNVLVRAETSRIIALKSRKPRLCKYWNCMHAVIVNA